MYRSEKPGIEQKKRMENIDYLGNVLQYMQVAQAIKNQSVIFVVGSSWYLR